MTKRHLGLCDKNGNTRGYMKISLPIYFNEILNFFYLGHGKGLYYHIELFYNELFNHVDLF